MKSINECVEETGKNRQFARKENSKTFKLEPCKDCGCHVIRIDGCVIAEDKVKRCDYLFLTVRSRASKELEAVKKAFFVELKGDDIKIACEQLYNSIDRTRRQLLNYETAAIVVSTKDYHPNLNSNKFYKKVKKLIGQPIRFEKVHKGNNYTHTETI